MEERRHPRLRLFSSEILGAKFTLVNIILRRLIWLKTVVNREWLASLLGQEEHATGEKQAVPLRFASDQA